MIPALVNLVLLTAGLGLGYLAMSWRLRPFPLAAYCVASASWSVAVGLACWWTVLAENAARSVLSGLFWVPLLGLGFAVVGAVAALLLVAAAKAAVLYVERRR